MVKGASVKLLGAVPLQLIGLLTTLLCFRLLLPESYGAYSLALAIYGFSDIFTNPSVNTFLIREKNCSDHAINVAFSISALRGVVLTPVFWVIAPALSTAVGGDESVTEMLRLLCLGFFLSGLRNLHVVRFHQKIQMGRVLLVESVGSFLGALVGIGLLYLWRAPMALVAGGIAGQALNTSLSWVFSPTRARFVWDKAELRRLWNFTRFLLANSLIIYALLNLDDLMVARLAGVASLGLYAISYNMVNSALLFVIRPLQGIVLPALSELQDDREKLTSAMSSVVSTFSFISWMVCSSIWMVAEDLFRVLGHGDDWEGAAPVFRALLPFVLIRGINGSMGQLLLALGKPRWITAVSGAQLLFMVPLGLLGFSTYDFLGLVVAVTALNGLAMVALVGISARHLDTGAMTLLSTIALPVPAAAAAAGSAYLLNGWLHAPALRLSVSVAGSLVVFAVTWELICRLPLRGLARQSLVGLVQRIFDPSPP